MASIELNLKIADDARAFIEEALETKNEENYTLALFKSDEDLEAGMSQVWSVGLFTEDQIEEYRAIHAKNGHLSFASFEGIKIFIVQPELAHELDGKILAYGPEYMCVQELQ